RMTYENATPADVPKRRLNVSRGGIILAAGGAGLVSGVFRGRFALRQVRQVLAQNEEDGPTVEVNPGAVVALPAAVAGGTYLMSRAYRLGAERTKQAHDVLIRTNARQSPLAALSPDSNLEGDIAKIGKMAKAARSGSKANGIAQDVMTAASATAAFAAGANATEAAVVKTGLRRDAKRAAKASRPVR
ncbi:MAG: hypothetical protein ACRDQZ_12650, partial [Mycobacteriales bacterium]